MEETNGDDKTFERLLKNRESARESRKRKKAQMEQIENRLHELEEQNRILLLELKKGKEHVILEEEEKWTITKQLGEVYIYNIIFLYFIIVLYLLDVTKRSS